jgi:hypothetical protein
MNPHELACYICVGSGHVTVTLFDGHNGAGNYLLDDWPQEVVSQPHYKVPCPECGGTGNSRAQPKPRQHFQVTQMLERVPGVKIADA